MAQHLTGWRGVLNEPKWLVIYTMARTEKKVNERLEKQGIETFLPLQKVLKQWSDRRKWVYEPLFRSYIFVRIRQTEYMQVVETPGVVKFVYFEGQPAVVPEYQLDNVRRLLANEIPLESLPTNIKPGDRIRVISGPLMEMEGWLVDFKGHKRVMVRIDGIEQVLGATLPLGDIEKVKTKEE